MVLSGWGWLCVRGSSLSFVVLPLSLFGLPSVSARVSHGPCRQPLPREGFLYWKKLNQADQP